jgi:hypothetical protein
MDKETYVNSMTTDPQRAGSKYGQRAPICLNCGDNRSEENKALCQNCANAMVMGGHKGDDL